MENGKSPFRTAQVPTPSTPGAAMAPGVPIPSTPSADPGMATTAPRAEKPSSEPENPRQRETQVRDVIKNLRQVIVELGQTIYEIMLTDFQVSDIAERLLETFSDSVNDITVDRVREIGMGLIGGEGTARRRK